MNLLLSSAGRWLLGGLAGAVLLLGGWLYVDHLQRTAADLQAQLQSETAQRQQAERNQLALGDELQAERSRAAKTETLKETVREAPSGTVPADIRAALDGLRND